MKTFYKIALLGFLFVNTTKLTGQIVFQVEEDKADLAGSMIYIANRGNQSIKFSLSLNRSQWQNFELKSRESGNAWPQNRSDFQYIYIKVKSANGLVEYKLAKQKRFEIYWNRNKNCWDVGLLGPQGKG